MKRKLMILFGLLFLAFGCNEYVIPELKDGVDGKDGLNGANAAWEYEAFGPTDDYPAGGIRVVTGLDNYPYDGVMDIEMGPGFVLVNGNDADSNVGAGQFPVFTVVDCHLFADDIDLGYVCGADGTNGTDGKDGTQWTINEDGYWVKDGVVTEISSVGPQGPQGPTGEAGLPGPPGQDGKDGLTLIPWPLVTEIPATDLHTNGGYLYTWYMLGADLQITEDSQIIGAYPVWHGNDGKDGDTPYYNEETNTWWINNYDTKVISTYKVEISDNDTWIINGEDTGKPTKGADGHDGADGKDGVTPTVELVEGCDLYINDEFVGDVCGSNGIDGVSPEIREIGGVYYWFVWNGVEFINTNVTAEGKNGTNGTNGTDGTTVDFGVESVSPGDVCVEGGTKILVYLDEVYTYSFTICNGPEGPIGPQGPQGDTGEQGPKGDTGSCGCDDGDNFCETPWVEKKNSWLINENLNNGQLPSGWTSVGKYSDGVHIGSGNGLTVCASVGPKTSITTEAFKATKVKQVTINLSTTTDLGNDVSVRPVIIHVDGTETLLDYKNIPTDNTVNLTWNGEWSLVKQIRFEYDIVVNNEVLYDDYEHLKLKIVQVKGNKVICEENPV